MTSPEGSEPPPILPSGREKPPHPAEGVAQDLPPAGFPIVPPPPPRSGADFGAGPPVDLAGGRPPTEPYPMRFDVDYPHRFSRLSTAFRIFLLLPLLAFAYLVAGGFSVAWLGGRAAVFCRRTYPHWLFATGSAFLAWAARLQAYALLQTDRYPSFDAGSGPVRLEYDEPPPRSLSRWHGIVLRMLLVIPHLVVLYVLFIGVQVVVFIAWFAILFTGRYPRGMFGFVTGVSRWQHRVSGYFLGFTDRFPPFSRDPVAGAASGATLAACAVLGVLAAGGIGAGITAAVVYEQGVKRATVDYADLEGGEGGPTFSIARLDGNRPGVVFTLTRVTDPGDRLVQVLDPGRGERVVVFEWLISTGDRDAVIDLTPARFKTTVGGESRTYGAELTTLGGRGAPVTLGDNAEAILRVVFVVPDDAQPVELQFDPSFHPRGGVVYEFR